MSRISAMRAVTRAFKGVPRTRYEFEAASLALSESPALEPLWSLASELSTSNLTLVARGDLAGVLLGVLVVDARTCSATFVSMSVKNPMWVETVPAVVATSESSDGHDWVL